MSPWCANLVRRLIASCAPGWTCWSLAMWFCIAWMRSKSWCDRRWAARSHARVSDFETIHVTSRNALALGRRRPSSRSDSMANPVRLDNLDLVRGLAALLVLAGHVRAYIFQNYSEAEQTSVLLKAFYFVTGLGHEAVII